MSSDEVVQVSVEIPVQRVRLIRVTGRLDRQAAASVLRLVDAQLDLIAGRHRAVTDLVIDIGGVSSFGRGGLESLRHASFSAGRRGIGLYLSGCGGRVHLLPLRAQQVLRQFRTFPTAEVAMDALTGNVTPQPRPSHLELTTGVLEPDSPPPHESRRRPWDVQPASRIPLPRRTSEGASPLERPASPPSRV